MKRISEREKVFISIIVFLLLVVSVSFFYGFGNEKVTNEEFDFLFYEEEEVSIKDESFQTEKFIIVDVKGAVHTPGVYKMLEGSRVIDVIEEAGGLLDEADEWKVNLAEILEDEMVVFIPFEGNEFEEVIFQNGKDKSDKVRINKATIAELETLPGIGPAKANAIISYREEHGPFKTVEDLLNISGIGPKSLEKLREFIIIN